MSKTVAILTGLGIVAVSVFWGWCAHRAANLHVLFDGPVTVVPRETPEYFPTVRYQLSEPWNAGASIWEDHIQDSDVVPQTNSQTVPQLVGESGGTKSASDTVSTIFEQSDRSPEAIQLRLPSVYRDRRPYRSLQIIHPEDRSVFPPNLCAPYIEWEDPVNNLWMIRVQFGPEGNRNERSFISREKRWRFPKSFWKELRTSPSTGNAQFSIKGIRISNRGERENNVQVSETVYFEISPDPVDNYLVYRIVSPPFNRMKTPDLRIRDVRRDGDELFLSSHRQYCINCHAFSSKEGDRGKLSLQVRFMGDSQGKLKTYLAFYDLDTKQGKKVLLPFNIQMSTFMAWSPDGTKLAYSANQKLATLYPITYETQLASTQTADLAIYDDTREMTYLLPGASDPSVLENYPYWSPDGKLLVFARAGIGEHPTRVQYELFYLPFEDGQSAVPVPIEGASNNGHSNFYPRFSPDGKWFSFCQSDGGDLIRSSSNLYLKTADLLGAAWRLECNAEFAADSWHSWSSNSRWIVFASKRTDGTFSYLYLTHIGKDGHASPGVRLPEKDPPLASYNIPEFVAKRPPVSNRELFESLRVEQEPVLIRHISDSGVDSAMP